MEPIALLIAATMNAGTVLAIASLGLLINERAGIVNLGAEGMMLVAAIAGFATGVHTGNDWLAFAAGAMIYVVAEELIPEARLGHEGDIATIGVMFGFTLMMILDVALG